MACVWIWMQESPNKNGSAARARGKQWRFQVVRRGGRRRRSSGGHGLAISSTIKGRAVSAGAKEKEAEAQMAEAPRQPSATTCCTDSSESSWATDPSSW